MLDTILRITVILYLHCLMTLWTACAVYKCNWTMKSTCVELTFVYQFVMTTALIVSMTADTDADDSSGSEILTYFTKIVSGLK